MRENVNVRQSRQRCESNRGPGIIGENKKGRTRGPENTVVGHAVQDCAHPMLADTETDVAAARIVTSEIAALLDVIHGRAIEIGAATDQIRHRFRDRLKHFATRFARRQLRIERKRRDFLEQILRNFLVDSVV